MSAYVIFIRDNMLDRAGYDEYLAVAAPTLAKHHGEIIVFNGEIEALEGAAADGSVVIKFPDMQAARNWYYGAEYAAVKSQRIAVTQGRAVLVAGIA
ncbi:DUF1330 domain-containing protein [Testudinibacter aquarius]|uniref:DUF1330 domain-containing protein n=1 Tax=Testudinibacter aquarius TaxID=1524974 RepID=A0A4R3YFG6_9PAST|nr:DUF1330 domain-containing protein [Testudinibacter aquarius]KAE9528959.1 hypothetical protein A1D24_08785 [Testudinibacter aquarius]TCV89233.1 uncharacterized protein (DUF1330 family) [Testudinibacter aquarius]TNG93297.1 DUF1330 domain-containing protein [Testudinibacter aquarius]